MENNIVPLKTVGAYLSYSGCRSYTFTRDIVGKLKPVSPVDRTNASAKWSAGNWYPTTDLLVPFAIRSYLFDKKVNIASQLPLDGELNILVEFDKYAGNGTGAAAVPLTR